MAWLVNQGWISEDGGATFRKGGTYGSAVLTLASGELDYTLDDAATATEALDAGDVVSESFTVRVRDDQDATATATATFDIDGSDDRPTLDAVSDGTITDLQDDAGLGMTSGLAGTLVGDDVDDAAVLAYGIQGGSASTATFDATDFEVEAAGSYGTLYLDRDAHGYRYEPDASAVDAVPAGSSPDDVFTFTVSDDGGTTTTSTTYTVTIIGANEAVVLSDTSDPAAVNEAVDASAQNLSELSGSFALADSDAGDTLTATVTSGPTVTMNGTQITSGFPAALTATGVFVVVPTVQTSVAGDETALTWTYDPAAADLDFLDDGDMLAVSYGVTVDDGTADSAEQDVTISISGTNDAPTLASPTAGAIAEDADAGTTTDTGLSGTLAGADEDADTMLTYGIDGGSVEGDGTVTLSGTYGTLSVTAANGGYDYAKNDAAIEALNAGDTPSDSFTVTVTDDRNATATATYAVNLTGADDSAVIGGDVSGTVTEAGGVANGSGGDPRATGTLTVTDADGADTFVAIAADTASSNGYGTVSLATDGAWTYDLDDDDTTVEALNDGDTLADTFTAETADGTTQLVTITIQGTNDAPTISSADATGSATERTDGAADENAGTLSDTGAIDFDDVDTDGSHVAGVAATVGDGAGGSVATPLGTLSLSAVDQQDDTVTWTFEVAAADLDALPAGEVRTQVYTVTIDDGATSDPTVAQTVTITLTGTNDAPILTLDDATGTIAEADAGATLRATGALSVADADVGDGVAAVTATPNDDVAWSGGTLSPALTAALEADLTIDGDLGGWTFETVEDLDFLAASESITLSFDLVAEDDSSATNDTSNAQTVTITISGTNDAPTLTLESGDDSTADLTEADGELTAVGTLTVGDLDIADVVGASVESVATTDTLPVALDQTALLAMMSATSDLGAGGTTGTLSWTFDSVNGGTGADETFDFLAEGERVSLTYGLRATDGAGAFAPFPVTVFIEGRNDAAVITAQGTSDTSVTEAGGTANGTPGDATASGSFTSSDVDGTDDAFEAVTSAAASDQGYGTYTVAAGGAWSYALDDDDARVDALADGATLTDTFVVRSEDGTEATVTITVTGANDAPTAGTIADQASVDGTEVSFDIAPFFGDVDTGDTRTYAVTVGSLPAGLTLAENGLISDTLAAGASASSPYDVTVTATDAGGLTVATSFEWTVTNVGPTVVTPIGDRSVADGTTGFSLDVSGNFTAPDGDAMTFAAAGLPDWLEMTSAGVLQLAAGNDSVPSDASQQRIEGVNATRGRFTVTVTATDDDGDAVTDAFTLSFTNTVPSAADVTGATTENAVVLAADTTDALLSGASDADGDALRISAADGSTLADASSVSVAGNDGGTFTVHADGAYAFEPGSDFDRLRAGQLVTTSVTFTVTDDEGGSDGATLTVTVTGVNDAPVISVGTGDSASATLNEDETPFEATGTLSVADVDLTDVVGVAVTSLTTSGPLGTLDATDDLLPMLNVDATAVVAADVDEGDATWTFAPDAATFAYLNDGESLDLVYDVVATDDSGTADRHVRGADRHDHDHGRERRGRRDGRADRRRDRGGHRIERLARHRYRQRYGHRRRRRLDRSVPGGHEPDRERRRLRCVHRHAGGRVDLRARRRERHGRRPRIRNRPHRHLPDRDHRWDRGDRHDHHHRQQRRSRRERHERCCDGGRIDRRG